MISPITIDKVFETARIEEVVGDYVELKRSGSNYKGLSPFNSERTPSFMVSPSKQIWKDFSSGKGGNMVSFLMEYNHMTYPEAIRHIANKYNIEIIETVLSEQEATKNSERESLYIVTHFAKTYYHNNLLNSEEGRAIGLSYLSHRGLKEDAIDTFQLGYALKRGSSFTETALKEGHQVDFLEQAGLSIQKDNEAPYDRFRERIMFPIHSLSGKILGFGGRTLSNKDNVAKYINSPETLIYDKSKILYGIFQAKSHIARENSCYLVEGYTDVIQLHQAGIKNVVALSGTALTTEQIRLVKRLTKNITILFDGDSAGVDAASRGVDLCLEEDINLRVCVLPTGEDPDSFSKNNPLNTVLTYLNEESKDFIQFKASLLATDEIDPAKKSEAIHEIIGSILKIPNPIKQELYIKECAEIMSISETVLHTVLNQIAKAQVQSHRRTPKQEVPFEVVTPKKTSSTVDRLYVLERKLIQILILYGDQEEVFTDYVLEVNEQGEEVFKRVERELKVFEKIYLDLQQDETSFSTQQFKVLYEKIISNFNQNGQIIAQQIISESEAEESAFVSELIMEEEQYHLEDWESKNVFIVPKERRISQLVTETILSLRSYLVHQIISELQNQTAQGTETHHEDTLEAIKNYLDLKKHISNQLSRVINIKI